MNDKKTRLSLLGHGATFTVAANDAIARVRANADYVCDGIADDVQIQAAIDALPASGGTVHLSEGIFSITATISLGDDSSLIGQGDGSILELADSSDTTLLTNKNSTPATRHGTGNFRITVRHFKVDGNKANQGAGADTIWCVGFSTVDTLRIENLNIINGWTAGLRTEFCTNVIIANNRIDDSGDDCIAINEETSQAVVSGNILTNAGQSGKSYGGPFGIEIQDGATEVMVIGNYVSRCEGGGIVVNVHAGETVPADIVISGNIVENSVGTFAGYAIAVTGLSGKIINSVVIANNMCHANPKGIYTDFANNILIEGNVSHESLTMGIEIRGDCQYVKVANNYCYDNGAGEAGSQIGIGVHGDDSIVEGNECRDTRAGGARTQQWGIYIYSDSDSSVIKNNRVQNNSSGQMGLDGSNLVVQNNIGYVTENKGAAANINDGGTIAHGLAGTPSVAIASPSVASEMVSVTGLAAANITVAIKKDDGTPGTQQTIYWRAWL